MARLSTAGLPAPERPVSADMVTRGKPDPEPYRMGAERIGQPAAECLVVEDAPSGVRAGKAAGCRVLGVEGTHVAAELWAAGADFVVASLLQVSVLVDSNELRVRLAVR